MCHNAYTLKYLLIPVPYGETHKSAFLQQEPFEWNDARNGEKDAISISVYVGSLLMVAI